MSFVDHNLRRYAPRARAGAALPRCSRLARLPALLLCVFTLPFGACVVPVAPEFQDPVGSQNHPPYIYGSDPYPGSPVVDPNNISVTPADPDVGDAMHVRWLADYMTRNERFIDFDDTPSNDGNEVRPPVHPLFDCRQVVALPSHLIMVVISDRPFVPSAPDSAATQGSTPVIRTWTFVPSTPCGTSQ